MFASCLFQRLTLDKNNQILTFHINIRFLFFLDPSFDTVLVNPAYRTGAAARPFWVTNYHKPVIEFFSKEKLFEIRCIINFGKKFQNPGPDPLGVGGLAFCLETDPALSLIRTALRIFLLQVGNGLKIPMVFINFKLPISYSSFAMS